MDQLLAQLKEAIGGLDDRSKRMAIRNIFGVVRPAWVELRDKPPGVYSKPQALSEAQLAGCRCVPTREHIVGALPKGGRVAEVGTSYGSFAKTILTEAVPKELHLLDITFERFETAYFENFIAEGTVRTHQGNSSELLESFPDEYFDWIYIDADHSYFGCKKDVAVAQEKVRHGGYLVFDDYVILNHFDLGNYGVARAVHELCIEDGWRVSHLSFFSPMNQNIAVQRPDRAG
ncbi:MAG: class I SAM-dependent methyltransferase [Pseudomonadota bacterium]